MDVFTRLQWSRQDGELSATASDSDGVLTIYNSQPTDSGIYTCTAVDRSSGTVEQEVRARVSVNAPPRSLFNSNITLLT